MSLHSILFQIRALYIALIPGLAMIYLNLPPEAMHFRTFYFFFGMFVMALYFGLGLEHMSFPRNIFKAIITIIAIPLEIIAFIFVAGGTVGDFFLLAYFAETTGMLLATGFLAMLGGPEIIYSRLSIRDFLKEKLLSGELPYYLVSRSISNIPYLIFFLGLLIIHIITLPWFFPGNLAFAYLVIPCSAIPAAIIYTYSLKYKAHQHDSLFQILVGTFFWIVGFVIAAMSG